MKKENPVSLNSSSSSTSVKTEDISSKEEPMEAESEDSNTSLPGLRSSRRCKAKSPKMELAQEESLDSDSKDIDALAENGEGKKEEEEAEDGKKEAKEEQTNEDNEQEEEDFITPDTAGAWSIKVTHEIELAALEEVEALEERIFQASLQAKVQCTPHVLNSQGWVTSEFYPEFSFLCGE